MRRPLSRRPSPAMAVALLALCLALSGSALAEPIADGAATLTQTAKRALGLGKKANKRSKNALRTARAALQKAGTAGPQGPAGPAGPQGPPGSDAQFNGAAAGGALTGAYPNPDIAANAVNGEKIANGSITANDLGDGSVASSHIFDGQVFTGDLADFAVTAVKIWPESVTSSALGTITSRSSSVVVPAAGAVEGNGSYATREVTVNCAAGEQVIAGGTSWDYATGADADQQEVTTTSVVLVNGISPNAVRARGGNDTDQDHTFRVQALCLAP